MLLDDTEIDDSLHQAKLRKQNIQAGYILWLRKQIDEHELLLLEQTGLEDKALNHSVVVIDKLVDDPNHVQICMMTSLGGKTITASGVNLDNRIFYLPVFPSPSHLPSSHEPLRLEGHAVMRKNSYVKTKKNYRMPLVLLTRFERHKKISSHRLTRKSLEMLRTACDLNCLSHDHYQHPEARQSTHALLLTTSPLQSTHALSPTSSHLQSTHALSPTSNRLQSTRALPPTSSHLQSTHALPPTSSHLQSTHTLSPTSSRLQSPAPAYQTHLAYETREHHTRHQIYGTSARLPGLYVDEQQPLLPQFASRNQPRRLEVGGPRRPYWQAESEFRGASTYHSDAPSNPRPRSNVLRAFLICASLCTTIAIFGLLGYGLFLGGMWLIHGLVAVVVAIKEDVVAFGRAVAKPFMAASRRIRVGVKGAIGFYERTVELIRRARS